MIKEQKKYKKKAGNGKSLPAFLFFGFSLSLFAEISNCCNHGSDA